MLNSEMSQLSDLHAAVMHHDVDTIQRLLYKKADINAKDITKQTPLMLAAFNGNPELLRLLLDQGADSDLKNDVGNTALDYAIHGKSDECAALLINHCTYIDSPDKTNATALMYAAYYGLELSFHELIDNGADIERLDDSGSNVLMHAVLGRNENIVKELCNYKTLLDTKNNEGKNALMIAAAKGYHGSMQHLIKAGVDLGLLSDNDESALEIAIINGHDHCALLLIEAGVDLEKADQKGMTAFSYALLSNNFNVTSELLKHNVKITHPILLEMMINQQNAYDPRIRICQDALNKQYPDRKHPNDSHSASQEIVIIPFVLNTENNYEKLKADQKIDLLATRISEVCELLKKQKPDARWIIGWREYGIRDVSRRSISDATRMKLKTTMKALSKHYPNLIIIAGSVLTRKEKKVSELSKLIPYYDRLKWLENIESQQSEYLEDQYLLAYRNKIQKLLSKYLDNDQKITVTANKARIYYHGDEKRHGKIAPYYETQGLGELAVYQPGKGKNLSPIVKIDDKLSMAISICREMHPGFDFVRKSHPKDCPPLLHFVLSYSIPLPLMSMDATNAILHLDRRYDPAFILPRGLKKSNAVIQVYPVAIDKKIENLNYSVKPIYPVQFQILDSIDKVLSKTSNFLVKMGLKSIKTKTMELLPYFYIPKENYLAYIKFIKSRTWPLNSDLRADILSLIEKADVQHTFTLTSEENTIALRKQQL